MTAKSTVVILLHGANQASKTEATNRQAWTDAIAAAERDVPGCFAATVVGEQNGSIAEFHESQHAGATYPSYSGWESAWYGGVWQHVRSLPEGNRGRGRSVRARRSGAIFHGLGPRNRAITTRRAR